MAMRDSISAIKAKVEELKRIVQVQRARRVEYGPIISQQSLALAKKLKRGQSMELKKMEKFTKLFHGTTEFLVFRLKVVMG